LDTQSGTLFRRRLTPTLEGISRWLAELPQPVAATYEAGPTGFGLVRQLTAAGVRCVVAAPSKLQRPTGDRVKTDTRDAEHLARLLRMDQIVPVRVPSDVEEAARDLVRAREDVRGDLMRVVLVAGDHDRLTPPIPTDRRAPVVAARGATRETTMGSNDSRLPRPFS
jgi:transposase